MRCESRAEWVSSRMIAALKSYSSNRETLEPSFLITICTDPDRTARYKRRPSRTNSRLSRRHFRANQAKSWPRTLQSSFLYAQSMEPVELKKLSRTIQQLRSVLSVTWTRMHLSRLNFQRSTLTLRPRAQVRLHASATSIVNILYLRILCLWTEPRSKVKSPARIYMELLYRASRSHLAQTNILLDKAKIGLSCRRSAVIR